MPSVSVTMRQYFDSVNTERMAAGLIRENIQHGLKISKQAFPDLNNIYGE